jgi:CelD/BcsL family acetyltransferase involved in cellulose biosynthesis
MYTIEKITARQDLDQLEGSWNTLLEESASNSLMLTWEWLTSWWDVFGQGRELYVLVVRDGKQIIGIAPLLVRAVQHYGVLPYRRLEFLASGEDEADEICSEYMDFIIRSGSECEVLSAVFEYLLKDEQSWDEMLLSDISERSPNLPLLEKLCDAYGIKHGITCKQVAFYLPLQQDWESFFNKLPKNLRRNIRRDRQVAKLGGGKLRLVDRIEEFEENFEALIQLHQSRWTSLGKPGVFASEKFTRFHRLVAPKLLSRGWLKLFVLSLSGKPVSALYNFAYNNRMHYYQSGFIREGGQLCSPGVLLHSYAIEKAIKEGFSEYDFMKGEVSGYKTRWGGQTRCIVRLRMAKAQSKEFIYGVTTKLVDGLRQIRRRVS